MSSASYQIFSSDIDFGEPTEASKVLYQRMIVWSYYWFISFLLLLRDPKCLVGDLELPSTKRSKPSALERRFKGAIGGWLADIFTSFENFFNFIESIEAERFFEFFVEIFFQKLDQLIELNPSLDQARKISYGKLFLSAKKHHYGPIKRERTAETFEADLNGIVEEVSVIQNASKPSCLKTPEQELFSQELENNMTFKEHICKIRFFGEDMHNISSWYSLDMLYFSEHELSEDFHRDMYSYFKTHYKKDVHLYSAALLRQHLSLFKNVSFLRMARDHFDMTLPKLLACLISAIKF